MSIESSLQNYPREEQLGGDSAPVFTATERSSKYQSQRNLYAFGTGAIFTAIMLTFREKGYNIPPIGICVNHPLEVCHDNLDIWRTTLTDLLKQDINLKKEPFGLYDKFIGKGYRDPTEACLDAILLIAEKEGVLLNPVYRASDCHKFVVAVGTFLFCPLSITGILESVDREIRLRFITALSLPVKTSRLHLVTSRVIKIDEA